MDMKKRKIAAMLCIVVVFVMFSSLFYIEKEIHHDCTGHDCPICACIQQAEQNIRNIRTLGSAVTFSVIVPVLYCCILPVFYIFVLCISLISTKVRLND